MRVFNILLFIWKVGAPVRWVRAESLWERRGRRVWSALGRRRLSPPLRTVLKPEAVEGNGEAESGLRAGRTLSRPGGGP